MLLFRRKEKQPGLAPTPTEPFVVAPRGGRVFRMRDFGYQIWIPEGWRMGGEESEGRNQPIFFRERKPNGAVRISQLQDQRDPIASVLRMCEKARGKGGVMDFQSEIRPDRAWFRYRQIVSAEGQASQDTHAFVLATREGSVLVSFAHDASTPEENVRDELAAFQKITDAIVPL